MDVPSSRRRVGEHLRSLPNWRKPARSPVLFRFQAEHMGSFTRRLRALRKHNTTERSQLLDSSLEHILLADVAPPSRALHDPSQKKKCQPYLEAVAKSETNIGGVGPRQRKRTTHRRGLIAVPRCHDARKRRAIASFASGVPVSDAAFFARSKREGAI